MRYGDGPEELSGVFQVNSITFGSQRDEYVIFYQPPRKEPGGMEAEWACVNPKEPRGST